MKAHFLAALCLCSGLWTFSAQAGEKAKPPVPESFLSADTLFYFRYDGYEAHKVAYDKTALARIMNDDLGKFLEYVGPMILDNLVNERRDIFFPGKKGRQDMLGGPLSKALQYFWRHGLVVALEIPEKNPPPIKGRRDLFHMEGLQATVVFPQGGEPKNKEILNAFLRTLVGLGNLEATEQKIGQRTMQRIVAPDFQAAWWAEGPHLIFTMGTLPPSRTLDVIEGRLPNLLTSSLHKGVVGFDRYETDMRGHLDLEKLVDIIKTPPGSGGLEAIKEALKRHVALSQFGLTGLKGLSFHLGFDGLYQRSTVKLDVVEPKDRPGLLKLVSGPVSFDLKELPPMPPDAASVRVHHVDWERVHEFFFQLARLKDLAGAFREIPWRGPLFPALDLDFDFKKEIIPALDSTLVAYNALSEGPLLLGQVVAIKVKDPARLEKGLESLNRTLLKLFRWPNAVFAKKTYRGADLYILEQNRDFPIPVTYTIHKGWLVISPFPQAVQGYVFRSEGKYQVWKAPAITAQTLALAKKAGGPKSQLVAVHVSDPKPPVEVGLAILPPIVQIIQSFNRRGNNEIFDVSKIPNPQTVTEWLLPNVTVVYDDQTALRWESHTSLPMPLEEILSLAGFGSILFW